MRFRQALLIFAVAASTTVCVAADYSNRTISLVVGFPLAEELTLWLAKWSMDSVGNWGSQ